MRYYTFEDPEVDVVSALKTSLALLGRTDLRVATKRLNEEQGRNLNTEVIVRSDGELTYNEVLSENEFTIYIFTNGPIESAVNAEVNAVTQLVKAALKIVPSRSNFIKSVSNIRTSTLEDQGNTQVKNILFTSISRGIAHTTN